MSPSVWQDFKLAMTADWDRDLRQRRRWLHVLGQVAQGFGQAFTDLDLNRSEQESVKSLKKARGYHLIWAALNMVICVSNSMNSISGSDWWVTAVIVLWFGWETVKRTMKAWAAHKSIPMQLIKEIHED